MSDTNCLSGEEREEVYDWWISYQKLIGQLRVTERTAVTAVWCWVVHLPRMQWKQCLQVFQPVAWFKVFIYGAKPVATSASVSLKLTWSIHKLIWHGLYIQNTHTRTHKINAFFYLWDKAWSSIAPLNEVCEVYPWSSALRALVILLSKCYCLTVSHSWHCSLCTIWESLRCKSQVLFMN